MARIRESATLRYRFECEPRILEQRSAKLEPQPLLVLQRRKPSSHLEGTRQITRAHVGKLRQSRQSNRFSKVLAQPILDTMNTGMQVVAERKIDACLIVSTVPS
jgi:hypothetical protein